MSGSVKLRALYDAFSLLMVLALPSPYDVVRLKILYPEAGPAAAGGRTDQPRPVVVLLPGGLVESSRYQWLGERLVEETGAIVVSTEGFTLFQSTVFLTCCGGNVVDDDQRTGFFSSLFKKLADINTSPPLNGSMDLSRLVLGGHSFGGIAALLASDERLFPELKGVFTYGAHSAALATGASGLHPELNGTVPTLLLAGDADGLLKNARNPDGSTRTSAVEPVLRTFNESLTRGRPAYYVEFAGFNHFAVVDPDDKTQLNFENDFESAVPKDVAQDEIFAVVSLFVRKYAFSDGRASAALKKLLKTRDSPYITRTEFKV